jgi:hypothetical protein
MRQSIGSHFETVPGPTDEGHAVDGELLTKLLEIAGSALERHRFQVSGLGAATATRVVVDHASPFARERIEMRRRPRGDGNDDDVGAGTDLPIMKPHTIVGHKISLLDLDGRYGTESG